jgi:hypothetical protein
VFAALHHQVTPGHFSLKYGSMFYSSYRGRKKLPVFLQDYRFEKHDKQGIIPERFKEVK